MVRQQSDVMLSLLGCNCMSVSIPPRGYMHYVPREVQYEDLSHHGPRLNLANK
jgi:hypothetical protein